MSQYLTVEAVAEIMTVHTRTIRRYIKEKKLKAGKAGGQWRINSDDLKKFMGINSFEEVANRIVPDPDKRSYDIKGKEKVLVSAVVDVNVASKEEALRLSSTIMAAMNGRKDRDPARCDYLFYEEEGKARFMLWGQPLFVSTMLRMFDSSLLV